MTLFAGMNEEEFALKMKRELVAQGKELLEWEGKLKRFLETKHVKVQQMLGDDEFVSLSNVYVELTIVKEKPRQ